MSKDKVTPKKLGMILLETLKTKAKEGFYDKTASDIMNLTETKIPVDINHIKNELVCLEIYIIHQVIYHRFPDFYDEIIKSFRNELSKYLEEQLSKLDEQSSKEIFLENVLYAEKAVLYYMEMYDKFLNHPKFLLKFCSLISTRMLWEAGLDIRHIVYLTSVYTGGLTELTDFIDNTIELMPEEELDVNDLLREGVSLDELGKPRKAIEYYDKALEINPRDAMGWNSKGVALMKLGKPEQAIECYNNALEINPRDAMAWTAKGIALGRMKKPEQAIECFDKVLEINPRYATAWSNKGIVLGVLGKFEQAIECYDKALEINPRYGMAWRNKGSALRRLGKSEQAIECFDKALEINPRDAVAWFKKGTALGMMKKLEQARECFDKVLELNPTLAKKLFKLLPEAFFR